MLLGLFSLEQVAQAGQSEAAELSSLARRAFPDLTTSEANLVDAAAVGYTLRLSDEGDASATPPTSNTVERVTSEETGLVDQENQIRAGVLTWLCTEQAAAPLISHLGISVDGATIRGPLQLAHAKIAFPLSLTHCRLAEPIDLDGAQLLELQLEGTQVGSLSADHIRVERSLTLGYGFVATGEVRLQFARIGGNFDASGSRLTHPAPDALYADGARIDGDVLMRYGFQSEHRISFAGARIAGNLDGEQGQFRHPAGQVAINLESTTVLGSLILSNASVTGTLDLYGANIGGSFDADGALLLALGKTAVRGYGLRVGQNLWLVGATTAGALLFENAQIGRDLNLADLSLSDMESPVMVQLHGVLVGRRFRWTGIRTVDEQTFELDLRSAKVGLLQDEQASWPQRGLLRLHGFEYEDLHDESPVEAQQRIEWLRLQPTGRFRPQPYEQLAKVYREDGQSEAARRVLIAKEHDRTLGRQLSLGDYLWYSFFGPMIGYGYEPWRAFFLIIAEILLGALVFQTGSWLGWMSRTKEVEHVSDGSDRRLIISPDYPRFNALIYSLDVFTPLTYLHQADYWMPNPARGPRIGWGRLRLYGGEVLRVYYWFHIIAGWTLTSLLIAGLSGLVEHP